MTLLYFCLAVIAFYSFIARLALLKSAMYNLRFIRSIFRNFPEKFRRAQRRSDAKNHILVTTQGRFSRLKTTETCL